MHVRSGAPLALFVLFLGASQASCVDEEMHPDVAYAPAPGACGVAPMAGRMCGCVYDLPMQTRHLPDFALLRPTEMLCTDRLSVSPRSGPPGFPGVRGRFEWFGVDFRGDLVISQPGPLNFRLTSDDGARLYIDDVLVLNNDGYHPVRAVEGTVTLAPGPHHLRVPYWEGPGPMALTLEVARPGQGYEVLRVDRPL